ncbi:MAG: hypothetical protein CMJ25_09075 [Phycisphaerae bacterium]|nr:hypothetical protein [Phycisphaerae bacterium]
MVRLTPRVKKRKKPANITHLRGEYKHLSPRTAARTIRTISPIRTTETSVTPLIWTMHHIARDGDSRHGCPLHNPVNQKTTSWAQYRCAISPRTIGPQQIRRRQPPTGIGKESRMSNQNPMNNTSTNNTPRTGTPELTVIGADTRIKGEMFFEKSARILGHFEGKITAQGEVQIGNGANCNAAVEAEQIIVDGSVQGPLFARDRLTLTANAQVQGDLTAGTLVVSEGASFVGHCNVGPRAQEMTGQSNNTQTRPQNTAPITSEPKPSITTQLDLTPPWAQQESGSSVA